MNRNSKLFLWTVTVLLLVSLVQVECRRTYTSSGISRSRGNRGKSQSSGGYFSSWFGGSKSSSSGSSSSSAIKPAATKPVSSSTSAKNNWQSASSHATGTSKSSWANPHYNPSAPAVPSAPKATNYGWQTNTNSKSPGFSSAPYPVQSGVQHNSYGGFKPAQSVPNTHSTGFQPSQSIPNTHGTGFQPSTNLYRSSSNLPTSHGTSYQPSSAHVNPSSSFGGYHPSSGTHVGGSHPPSNSYGSHLSPSGYQPSHSNSYHAPSYQPSGYHSGAYPHQPSSGHYPSYTNQGYHPSGGFGGTIPQYQGTKLFNGGSGNYGYSGSGNWGVPSYGSKSSSGTGKLLTGLAVGAAGGYLTSSLVNRISNPWKYSGYGYGSGFGYGSGLGLGTGVGLGTGYIGSGYLRNQDESAFERGYERGVKDRLNENNKTPVPSPPETPKEEDPTSKWIHCVAFDPQTQQTLINPNCSCTVTTSLDERTGQPISVHHCTTLNGLVMRPIPVNPNQRQEPLPENFNNNAPPGGVNSPGVVPSYLDAYSGNGQYGAGSMSSLSQPADSTSPQVSATQVHSIKPDQKVGEEVTLNSENTAMNTTKIEEEAKTVEKRMDGVINLESQPTSGDNVTESTTAGKINDEIKTEKTEIPKAAESSSGTAEYYRRLQKIVNMGNFIDDR